MKSKNIRRNYRRNESGGSCLLPHRHDKAISSVLSVSLMRTTRIIEKQNGKIGEQRKGGHDVRLDSKVADRAKADGAHQDSLFRS